MAAGVLPSQSNDGASVIQPVRAARLRASSGTKTRNPAAAASARPTPMLSNASGVIIATLAPFPLPRLFEELAGTTGRRTVESILPRRTLEDVILPAETRRALDMALAQVTSHDLIFNRWGLG